MGKLDWSKGNRESLTGNWNTLCRGGAATAQCCFLHIPFINGSVVSIKVLKILACKTLIEKSDLFFLVLHHFNVWVSLPSAVIAGGELHPAFTRLQRTRFCFQGRGESSLPKPCAGPLVGLMAVRWFCTPFLWHYSTESTATLRLVTKEPVAFRRQLQHRTEFQRG